MKKDSGFPESFLSAARPGNNSPGPQSKMFDNPETFYYLCQSKNFKID